MIIQSLLDTDFYKFTMMQTVLHQFPGAMVEYRFQCRTPHVDLRPYCHRIQEEIDHLCTLRFTKDELDYLSRNRFFKSDFIQFLRIFQLDREFIHIHSNDKFELVIEGPWLHTILFEVPVLAIISEIYHTAQYPYSSYEEGCVRLQKKIDTVLAHPNNESFVFSDFGTRRRYSLAWHGYVIDQLTKQLPTHLSGTSNVLLAKKNNIKAIGTMAHEYLQACQALGPRIIHSQKFAFEQWAQEYRGELGIALSDVLGIDAFLRDFDLYFCKLFDGARQDSGDPFEWGEKLIAHYRNHRIDPKTKHLVFSDALNFPLALKLYDHFKETTNPAFGIGTNLTNDLGHTPTQIVIKMTKCNGQAVAKISDSPGKQICADTAYLDYLKQLFFIERK